MLPAIARDPSFIQNQADIDKYKEDLNYHFGEEVKTKKRIHELEQKMETITLSIMNKKIELASIIREKGRDNIQVKIINEEMEESSQQLKELRLQLEGVNSKMMQLLKKRESFQSEWKQGGLRDLQLEILNHILRENTILVENLEYTRKEQKSDL